MAFWLSTGSAPGSPRQVGQVLVLGSSPKEAGQAQNILEFVLTWQWTSSPMVGIYFIARASLKPMQRGKKSLKLDGSGL